MLTLEKKNRLKTLSRYERVDDTKAVLKFKYKKGQHIRIVFKKFGSKKDMFFFAVFRKVGSAWSCREVGYHSNLQVINDYLYKEYMEKERCSNVEFSRVPETQTRKNMDRTLSRSGDRIFNSICD